MTGLTDPQGGERGPDPGLPFQREGEKGRKSRVRKEVLEPTGRGRPRVIPGVGGAIGPLCDGGWPQWASPGFSMASRAFKGREDP